MKYDVMPFDILPPAKPPVLAAAVPAPRQVKPGLWEDPQTGRMFTRLNYPLPEAADQAMRQHDLPSERRDAPYRKA